MDARGAVPAQPAYAHNGFSAPGVVFSRRQLEEKLCGWKEDISSNAVQVYIHGLRKKLGPDFIRTVRGMGYVLPRE